MLWVTIALAGSTLLFMPGLLEQFETPKIELVRACGLGALAWGLVLGPAGRPARWSLLDRAVVAWLAVEILATLFSVSPRLSLVGETRQREGLLTSAALAGLYFAARDAFTGPRRVRIALDLILGLAALAGLHAIAQVTGHDPLQWQRQAEYAGGYVRPFATLGHPNLLGVIAAAAAAIGLALALGGSGAGRAARGGAAALLVVATLMTLSRAAWLGLGLGLPVAGLLALRERGTRLSPRALGIGALAVVAIGAVGLMTGGGGLIGRRLGEMFSGGGSGGSRIEIWRSAVAAWRDRPVLGQGPDLFEMVFTRFQTPAYWRLEWSGLPFHAHSIYLHTLATRGALGLLAAGAWAAALAASGGAAGRRGSAAPGAFPAAAGALAAIAVAGAFGALGITGALIVIVLSAIVASAAETAPAAAEPADARRERPRRAKDRAPARGRAARPRIGPRAWIAAVAAAAVAAGTAVWGFTELRASRAGAAAREFMVRDPARAVRASAVAVALAPHDDRLWRMHAQTLLWLTTLPETPPQALAEAEAAARRAVALAPARAENHIILARALATREADGDTTARAATEAEFRATFALAPLDGLSLMEYVDHEAFMRRPAAALEAARKAVALYPDEGPVRAALARAWVAAGESDSARVAYERALGAGWRDPSERAETERQLAELRASAATKP
jgi:O-antigen ligase